MSKAAEFVIRLVERVTGPARAAANALARMNAAEEAVTRAAVKAERAVEGMGAASATAASKLAQHARETERSAAASNRAASAAERARRAMQGQVVAGAALRINSSGQVSVDPFRQGFRAASPKGAAFRVTDYLRRQRMGSNGEVHGPVLDRSAQLPSIMHGPALDRRAQWGSFSLREKASFVGGRIGDDVAKLWQLNTAAGEARSSWSSAMAAFSSTPLGVVAGGVGSIASAMLDVAAGAAKAALAVGGVVVGIGALAAKKAVLTALEFAGKSETNALAFEKLTGNKRDARKWEARAFGTAKELGMNLDESMGSFKGMRAQQFDLETADKLVRFAADMSTISSHGTEGAQRILTQIMQVKSLGKLRGEELTVMAENGLSSDLVYKELEKRTGKNREQVIKMQQGGKIGSDLFVESVLAAGQAKFHSAKSGQAARDASVGTLDGLKARLVNLPDMVMYRLGRALDTGPVKRSLRELYEWLDKLQADGLQRFVQTVISYIPKATELIIGFGNGFMSGLDSITRALPGATSDFRSFGVEAGAGVAKFFAKIIEGVTWLAGAAPKMWDEFKRTFDFDAFLAKLADINLGNLTNDLVTIAGALGSIASATAAVARVVRGSSGFDQYQLAKQREELGPQDWSVKWQRIKDSATGADSEEGYVDPAVRMQRVRDELMAQRDRILEEQRAAARRGAQSSLATPAAGAAPHVTVHVAVAGNATSEDAAKIGAAAANGASDALRRVTRAAAQRVD